MMKLGCQQIAQAVAGELHGADEICSGVVTDSRQMVPGGLFVALTGERFDGHDYLEAARAAGAAAALAEQGRAPLAGLPCIVVADTRVALGRLAGAWRARFDVPVVAVTGSNGKTTVKEMTAAILRAHLGENAVCMTRGNLNNDIGLPLTLLSLSDAHRAAVVEMGMNRPGEIAWLASLARPTVAVVTNAQRAHLAGMGSLESVVREKGEIYDALDAAGTAVINADDGHAPYWRAQNAGRRVVTFGMSEMADVRVHWMGHGLASAVTLTTPQGETAFDLQLPGAHNALNAAAAAAATLAAGVSLDTAGRALAAFQGVKGRLQVRPLTGGATLIDDSYNANPDSVRAAIDVLAATVGRKHLVFGDMGETGERVGQFHDEVGGYAKSQGIDRLYTLGEHANQTARNFGDGSDHFENPEALVAALRADLVDGSTVLVKGSRFMRMERVVNALMEQGEV